MAFEFSLESVLRLRLSQERQEQARLEIAAQQVQLAQERCEAIKKEKLELDAKMLAALQAGMTSAELYFHRTSKAGLEWAEVEATQALEEARMQWNEQRLKFLAARRDRELLSSIRERRHEAYVIEQNRREQQQIDDLFAMRRNQNKIG